NGDSANHGGDDESLTFKRDRQSYQFPLCVASKHLHLLAALHDGQQDFPFHRGGASSGDVPSGSPEPSLAGENSPHQLHFDKVGKTFPGPPGIEKLGGKRRHSPKPPGSPAKSKWTQSL